jgi:hypothetical protein
MAGLKQFWCHLRTHRPGADGVSVQSNVVRLSIRTDRQRQESIRQALHGPAPRKRLKAPVALC